MRAVLYGARDLRLERLDLDPDSLLPDQIYVETLVSAFSTGTDLANYLGDSTYVPGAPAYPRAVGYSNVGRVVRVGASVSGWRAGQRVFSTKPHQSAYVAAASDLLVPVPDHVSSMQASLAYLAQLGLVALRQARYEPGEAVTVIGLGVIGLCTVAVASVLGAQVTAVSKSPARAEAARHMGARRTLLSQECPSEGTGGSDIVVLTANDWSAYRLAVGMARYGGRVSILGFPGRGQPAPEFNPLDPHWFYAKQLSLIGAGHASAMTGTPEQRGSSLKGNLSFLLERMADRALSLEPIISHRLPAERLREAYELALSHSESLLAAVFIWHAEAAD